MTLSQARMTADCNSSKNGRGTFCKDSVNMRRIFRFGIRLCCWRQESRRQCCCLLLTGRSPHCIPITISTSTRTSTASRDHCRSTSRWTLVASTTSSSSTASTSSLEQFCGPTRISCTSLLRRHSMALQHSPKTRSNAAACKSSLPGSTQRRI